MNPDIKRRWIDALRSGNFQQGRTALRTRDDRYCCLGVLCELAVADGVIDSPVISHEDESDESVPYIYSGYHDEDESAAFLPQVVAEWAEVSASGALGYSVRKEILEGDSLTYFNDRGASFYSIADIIEEYL